MNKALLKGAISLSIDLSFAILASFLALYLRLGNAILDLPIELILSQAFVMCVAALVANVFFQINLDVWSFFNIYYIIKYVKYSTLVVFLYTVGLFLINRLEMLPRSVIFINWILLILCAALPRLLYRMLRDNNFKISNLMNVHSIYKEPVIIIGLGKSAERFIQEMRSKTAVYRIVGIVDKKSNKGRVLLGVPILGDFKDLETIIESLTNKKSRPIRILVSPDADSFNNLQAIIEKANELAIPLSRLPMLTELAHNLGNGISIQPIAIEDLLRRSQRALNNKCISDSINSKNILITGAGGSIGSEIVRQIASFGAAKVGILDNSEFLLYEIEQEIKSKCPELYVIPYLIDIRDEKALAAVFEEFVPDIVFHAAALKHVPLLEIHKIEAVKTNVFGTINLLRLAKKYSVKRFIFISTDKAVEPLSFMGMTKRFAEICCQAFATKSLDVSIVRFGNVLGSNGSVVPLFEKQIKGGGPVTVTHPEATRYFMTIPEAVGLVLQSASLKENKGGAHVFVLDMGESISILELARRMIQLAGLKPDVDVAIQFTGLRPGEKIHEKLISSDASLQSTSHPDILLSNVPSTNLAILERHLKKINEIYIANEFNALIDLVVDIVKRVDNNTTLQ